MKYGAAGSRAGEARARGGGKCVDWEHPHCRGGEKGFSSCCSRGNWEVCGGIRGGCWGSAHPCVNTCNPSLPLLQPRKPRASFPRGARAPALQAEAFLPSGVLSLGADFSSQLSSRSRGILHSFSGTETNKIWPYVYALLSTKIPPLHSEEEN